MAIIESVATNTYHFQCQQIIPLTEDISKIFLIPQQKKIHYLPGQYVQAQLANGTSVPLSIANIPQSNGCLEIHLRHNASHPLAQEWIKELSAQQTVILRGPFGRFTAARVAGKQWLFLAGGTGFAPIRAILSELLPQSDCKPCHLFWGIKHRQDCYDFALIEHWQQLYPQFSYTIVLSEPQSCPHWEGPTGLVHEYLLNTIGNLQDVCVFTCGPYPMVKTALPLFLAQGLDELRFINDLL